MPRPRPPGANPGARRRRPDARFGVTRVEWARTAEDILERRSKHGLHLSMEQKHALERWLQRERPTVDA
jgi:D-erythritol 1-phosphate dehydrogenase